MTSQAKATFRTESWEETTSDEIEKGPKLVRVDVVKQYQGELEGEGRVRYQMMYRKDGSAAFAGFEMVRGSLGGRPGSFVFEHKGTYADGVVKSVWSVVPGSATGKLDGLQGEVAFTSGHADEYPIVVDYDFE